MLKQGNARGWICGLGLSNVLPYSLRMRWAEFWIEVTKRFFPTGSWDDVAHSHDDTAEFGKFPRAISVMLQSARLCVHKIPGLCWDNGSLPGQGYVWTHDVPALASPVLGLQVHTTMPCSMHNFFFVVEMHTLRSESKEVQSLGSD